MGKSSRRIESYTIHDVVIRAGDCVLMRPPDDSTSPYVAKVEAIEYTGSRKSPNIQILWYYRPEECVGGRQPFHASKELFLSDHSDLQNVDSIEGKCQVHSMDNYRLLDPVLETDFFCRFEYISATGRFTPEDTERFCKCNEPYNPDRFMIQCEECRNWFHPCCIGLIIDEEENKLDQFLCPSCLDKGSLSLKHKVVAKAKMTEGKEQKVATDEKTQNKLAREVQEIVSNHERIWCEGVENATEDFIRSVKKLAPSVFKKVEKDALSLARTMRSLHQKHASSFICDLTTLLPDLPVSNVALVFHEDMVLHEPPKNEDHNEVPERLTRIIDKLKKEKICERCVTYQAEEADIPSLLAVHSRAHVKEIQTISTKTERERDIKARKHQDIYYSEGSSKAALLAAGGAIKACKLVAEGRYKYSFAIVRPPGHHAGNNGPSGFCLLNNVAIGATHLLNKYKGKKVMIIDWDIHHGDGTQDIFYQDDRLLFLSVHRKEGDFFPGSGDVAEIGCGRAQGYNINVCWGHEKMRDIDYIVVWDYVVIPVIKEFVPDIILISAGFDAVQGDLLGRCLVTPAGFACLLKKLTPFARIAMVLEGGYDLVELPNCVELCVRVLLGEEIDLSNHEETLPYDTTWESILKTRKMLRTYWKVFNEDISMDISSRSIPYSKEEGVD